MSLWLCSVLLVTFTALVVYLSNLGGAYLDKQVVQGELQTLEQVKANTDTVLDTMAGRLSLLQSHVMRLDALGARLAQMASVDEIEFGIEHPPGVGGPQNLLDDDSEGFSDYEFLVSMNRLQQMLQDRQDKLTAMEAMLMGRSLRAQSRPLGNPAEGSWFSSLFGYRTDPISGKKDFHLGIDLAGKSGTPITSVASGIVTWSGRDRTYGNLVEISHGNGYITRYAHNRKNLVSAGQRVRKGEVIAVMGSSGRSTGTHVHFEVVKNGRHVNPREHLSLR